MQNHQNPLLRARLRRGLSLTEVGARTRLSPRVLRVLDEGRFGELPGGFYARGYVRAYASAVDLDPDETVDELLAQLPIAEDPIPRMLAIARTDDPDWLITLETARASAGAWVESLTARLRAHVPTGDSLRVAAIDGSILVVLQAILALLDGVDVRRAGAVTADIGRPRGGCRVGPSGGRLSPARDPRPPLADRGRPQIRNSVCQRQCRSRHSCQGTRNTHSGSGVRGLRGPDPGIRTPDDDDSRNQNVNLPPSWMMRRPKLFVFRPKLVLDMLLTGAP